MSDSPPLLALLQLTEQLGNVSKACQLMGYQRDSLYEIKRAFQTGGVAGWAEQPRDTTFVLSDAC
ncbi:helix-turn-helix domain-containing protein [Erwinia sp. V71]|uniref:helix-turn-helix domain-containing protein n=1 Tax=Erwinia sp. V71 TaxID=3369424 RepID=UPI003F63E58E